MITLLALLLAMWQSPIGRIVLFVIGGIAALEWVVHVGKKADEADPRSSALAIASRGAAMIALALLAWLRLGPILPAWFPWVALPVMIWGALCLFNGAKFSVGWRDPKLITRALLKAGVGAALYLLVWHANIRWGVPLDLLSGVAVFLYTTAPYGEWAVSAVVVWCLVTGLTRLLLVLRGYPSFPMPNPGTPHGNAPFTNPNDAAKGLKQ